MSPIARVFHDIKSGVNVDVYASMILALALAGVNIASSVFKWDLPLDLAPLNLGVLFFVLVVLLGNRRKLDELSVRFHTLDANGIVETFPDTYARDIGEANDVLQIGMHLSSDLNECHDAYRQLLTRKKKLRLLIADPEGHAFEMAAMRFPGGINSEQERTRARNSIQAAQRLLEVYPRYLEVRVLDYLFDYAALITNENGSNSTIYVERYTFRTRGGAKKPKFVFTPDDKAWYQLYTHEMAELWKEAQTILPPPPEAEG